ncbi:two-component system sensor histidine kinase NtrB [Vibrio sonorensis]|uniref:two-component system sensor histidine kinase NtrB n=1 Tax=Vibrio sonorensis TaxID=1004316 RepID=UPI001FE1B692|nr:PAS domain S-box protein [Vibrio sonorensis]
MAQDKLKRLSHAVESSQNSVMITDLKGDIIYVNPVFCELSGYSVSEVVGRNPKFLQSGQTTQNAYHGLWTTLVSGQEWRGEFLNKRKDGSLFWERAHISPVKDVNGQSLYYVAVKQDITEEKRLASEVERQTQQRLLHEKLATVGKVVNMIAHDLRNPLSSIKVGLQIHARNTKDEMFDIALEQVRYMEAILGDLSAYSKPEICKPEWLDIKKLFESVLAGTQRMASDHRVQLQTKIQDKLPTLYVDPVKIRQAFQNIVVNAIQATQSENCSTRVVKIQCQSIRSDNQAELRLTVENNGQQLKADLTDKAFEPFFTTKAKGTGLGLAIVKQVVDNHNGTITIAPSKLGTLVTICIPFTNKVPQSKKRVAYVI